MRRVWIGLAAAALVMAASPAGAFAQDDDDQDDGPDITRAPTLTGSAIVGSRLDAVGATWRGRYLTLSWYWLRCDTDSLWSCQAIDRAWSTGYTVTEADLGKRLRALLVVSNREGREYAWTNASSVVTAPPPPPPAPEPPSVPQPVVVTPPPVVPTPVPQATVRPRMMRPAPTIRIRGWLTPGGAHIDLLTVRAPRAAKISVRCFGRGCPRLAPAQRTVVTRLRRFEGQLHAGSRLVIKVTRAGFIGKHTVIRIRRGKRPLRRDRCLYPGAKEPTRCPGA